MNQADRPDVSTAAQPWAAPVLIGICTYRRNAELDRLLADLASTVERRYDGFAVGIAVADDNPDLSAREVTERWSEAFPLGTRWLGVASGNISAARNALLDAAVEAEADLCFLDDDEMPDPAWLHELQRVRRSSDADVVIGSVHRRFPADAPNWLHELPSALGVTYPDGSVPEVGITGNALISVSWLRQSGLRFEAELGTTGGEDVTFFNTAKGRGANVRYAANSLVWEIVPPARSTFSFQVGFEFRTGVHIARFSPDVPVPRLLARAARDMSVGVVRAAAALPRSRGVAFTHLGRAVRGGGIALGLLGLRLDHK